jgi:hypothetical protein
MDTLALIGRAAQPAHAAVAHLQMNADAQLASAFLRVCRVQRKRILGCLLNRRRGFRAVALA